MANNFPFIVQDNTTHEILAAGYGPTGTGVALTGQTVIELNPATVYDAGITARPALSFDTLAITANGTSAATLSGSSGSLPNPTTIQITEVSSGTVTTVIVTDGGPWHFTSSVVGSYKIYADAFPFQLLNETVVAS